MLSILFEVLLLLAYPMALGIEKLEINVQHVLQSMYVKLENHLTYQQTFDMFLPAPKNR